MNKGQIIHREKFHPTLTPEEFHNRYAFKPGEKCPCGRRAEVVCRVLMPLDELVKRDAKAIGYLLMSDGGPEKLKELAVETIHGTYIRVSTQHACKSCSPTLERVAARDAPSWCIVEFSRGPGPTRVLSGPGLFGETVNDRKVTIEV